MRFISVLRAFMNNTVIKKFIFFLIISTLLSLMFFITADAMWRLGGVGYRLISLLNAVFGVMALLNVFFLEHDK